MIENQLDKKMLFLKVKQHCLNLLSDSRCSHLPFHNVTHTLEVFKNVEFIGKHERLNELELEILKIAALFHDTGVAVAYKDHEAISSKNAQRFLTHLGYPAERIIKVMQCIAATRMPQQPRTKLERVMCDADLFHLSTDVFLSKNLQLRSEWKKALDLTFTDEEWFRLNFEFLSDHHYQSTYGKTVLEQQKSKNRLLMNKLSCEASS